MLLQPDHGLRLEPCALENIQRWRALPVLLLYYFDFNSFRQLVWELVVDLGVEPNRPCVLQLHW